MQVELISCLFTTSPGGQADGWLEELKLRLTQSSLSRTGGELGNKPDYYLLFETKLSEINLVFDDEN